MNQTSTQIPVQVASSFVLEFNFALGPAQSFIGAARTTNDFWAGSFVLSWLSGVAMVTARKMNAKFVYPVGMDALLDALEQGRFDAIDRQAAALPAKFCADVGAGFDAKLVQAAVRAAWRALADHTFATDVQGWPTCAGGTSSERRILWDQQINEAFDIQWTMHELVGQFGRRKHWRTQHRTPQVGVKCMLMPQFQEISMASTDAERRDFWRELSERTGKDTQPDERLSAPALVKRRLRRVLETLPNVTIATGNGQAWTLCGMPVNYDAPDTRKLSGKHSFYAIVRMDIDGLGAAPTSSYAAVNRFAQQVNPIVKGHSGYTLYAGGDDVLAFVPVANALACAGALRHCLKAVQDGKSHLTASAAVLICHEKSPLADALQRSQRLLSEVAKDATGRDALAVQLCKPGSDLQTYSAPWAQAWDSAAAVDGLAPPLKLAKFAALIRSNNGFSSGYIYWLRSYFKQVKLTIELEKANQEKKANEVNKKNWSTEMLPMMTTQYLHQQRGGDGEATSYEEALAQLTPLLDVCACKVRLAGGAAPACYVFASAQDSTRSDYSIEPALIGRFLAEIVREEAKPSKLETQT